MLMQFCIFWEEIRLSESKIGFEISTWKKKIRSKSLLNHDSMTHGLIVKISANL